MMRGWFCELGQTDPPSCVSRRLLFLWRGAIFACHTLSKQSWYINSDLWKYNVRANWSGEDTHLLLLWIPFLGLYEVVWSMFRVNWWDRIRRCLTQLGGGWGGVRSLRDYPSVKVCWLSFPLDWLCVNTVSSPRHFSNIKLWISAVKWWCKGT